MSGLPAGTEEGDVERFGVDRRTGLVLAGAAAFTVACVWLRADSAGMWAISGWHLADRRLLEALAAFAPHVRALRLEGDGSLRPLDTAR